MREPSTRGADLMRIASILAMSMWALFVALGWPGEPAHASTVDWESVAKIGGAGTSGGLFGASSPIGVAIDNSGDASSGDLYVGDNGNARVQKFKPSEDTTAFVLAFGWGVGGVPGAFADCATAASCTGGQPGGEDGEFESTSNGMGVAVGPTGTVYVAENAPNNRVQIFTSPTEASVAYAGQFSGGAINSAAAAPQPLEKPRGVAVNEAGDVYVVNQNFNVIDKFTDIGEYVCQITGKTPGSATECAGEAQGSETELAGGFAMQGQTTGANLAIDTSGHLYVADTGNNVVDEFDQNGVFVGSIGGGILTHPNAVAVDTTGNVFVGAEGGVYEFAAGTRAELAHFGSTELAEVRGIGIIGSGEAERVFVASSGTEQVVIYAAVPPPPTCATEGPTEIAATSASASGTITPNANDPTFAFNYGPAPAPFHESTAVEGPIATPTTVTQQLAWLEPHRTYGYQLVLRNAGHTINCEPETDFTTLSTPPAVGSENSSAISQTSATLEAQINPNNEETRWSFQYSPNSSLTRGVTNSPGGQLAASYGNRGVGETISDLEPNTVYYYRVSAEDEAALHGASSSASQGVIQSLLTSPTTPVTPSAREVTQHSATLSGTVTPGGQDTDYYVEYTSPQGGGATQIRDAGSGTAPVGVEMSLTALTPRTAYSYRLIVTNRGGVTAGPPQRFTTLPLQPAVAGVSATEIGPSTATLTGWVRGERAATTYRFQYGPTSTYGLQAPSGEGEVQAGEGAQPVIATITDLVPDTVYHFRLLARNSGGETAGEDETFTASGGIGNRLPPASFSLTSDPLGSPPAISYPSLTILAPPRRPPTTAKTSKTKRAARCRRRDVRRGGRCVVRKRTRRK